MALPRLASEAAANRHQVVSAIRRRAVFLDRDGTLTRVFVRRGKAYAPVRMRDFRLLPGVAPAVARLRSAGLLTIVATNQPDLGNGIVGLSLVRRMHEMLRRRLRLDDIRVCPHRQRAGCSCRKPKPGMLLAAAREHAIDLGASFMIGDRASDVLAGAAAGCYTVFIDRGYAETRKAQFHPDATARSLPEAVRRILQRIGRGA
jgi:D-glycero-D-manno-heptose 1,7-bisphosphate phosphatase